jgi:hypothetical protein
MLVAGQPVRGDARCVEGFLDRHRLLRMPRLALVERAQDSGPDAEQGVELLDRRIRSVRDDGAGLEQRAKRVGAVGHPGPVPVRELTVGGGVAELDGGRDSELPKAGDVLFSEELGVLDPGAEPARPPFLRGRLEGVKRLAVGEVADGVHGDWEPGSGGAADDVLELLTGRDLDPGAVQEARGVRPEGPVHERLDVADAHEVATEARANAEIGEGADVLVRKRLPHPQGERALAFELLPDGERPEPPVLVVDGGHAPGACNANALPRGVDHLLVRGVDVDIPEVPGALLSQDTCGLAALVALDHAALDLQVAVRLGERGRVEPQRVVVLRHQRDGDIAGDRVERLLRRLNRGMPLVAAPAEAA